MGQATMKIRVLFFAQLREAFGEDERIVDVTESTQVGVFVETLLETAGLKEWSGKSLRYAVNEEFVEGERLLEPDDVVAILTPVAGG